jgi:sporulation protein YlmC with PRC-barrel domain
MMMNRKFKPRLLALIIPFVAVALPAGANSTDQADTGSAASASETIDRAVGADMGATQRDAWRQARTDRLWNALDTNGDGRISRAEFDARHRALESRATGERASRASMRADRPLSHARRVRVSNLIGTEVRNPQGEDLGEIRDLLVDVHSGQVRYAVLEYGGILDVGGELFAVPITAFRPTANNQHLVVDIDNDKLERAPGFDRDQWPDFNDSDFLNRIDSYFGTQSSSPSQTRDTAPGNDTNESRSGWPHASPALWRASRLIGKDVDDKQGDDVGEIKDLVINMRNGQIRYVLLEYDKPSSLDNERWVVPMRALAFDDAHRGVTLDASLDQLETSRAFAARQWGVDGHPSAVEQYWLVLLPADTTVTRESAAGDASTADTTASSGASQNTSAAQGTGQGSAEASPAVPDQNAANAMASPEQGANAATPAERALDATERGEFTQNRRLPAAGGGTGGNIERSTGNSGSSTSDTGSSTSGSTNDTGGSTNDTGGSTNDTGSSTIDTGNSSSDTGSSTSDTGNSTTGTGSSTIDTGSSTTGTGSSTTSNDSGDIDSGSDTNSGNPQ